MATQLFNADVDLVTIQDLPCHIKIKIIMRYCKRITRLFKQGAGALSAGYQVSFIVIK